MAGNKAVVPWRPGTLLLRTLAVLAAIATAEQAQAGSAIGLYNSHITDQTDGLLADARCEGPWIFEKAECFQSAPRAECGTERPEQWAQRTPRAVCRLEAFGLEHFALHEETSYERVIRADRVNLCDGGSKIYTRLVDEAAAECEATWTDSARARLHPKAFARCASPRARCNFGGANSYLTVQLTAMVLVPVWAARENHPDCPALGPPESYLVAPAVYRACRHRLNGPADPRECHGEKFLFQSAPGLTRPELRHLGVEPGDVTLAHCSTCDQGTWPSYRSPAQCREISRGLWLQYPRTHP